MRRLFFGVLLLISGAISAQTKTVINPASGNKNTLTHFADGLFTDSMFFLRPFCGAPSINMAPYMSAKKWSAIALDSCANVWYGWNPSTNTWSAIGVLPNLAKITFNYGFVASQNPYDPYGLDMNVLLDTALINQYVTTVIQNDTSITTFLDSSNITYFVDSTRAAPDFTVDAGTAYLVAHSGTSGVFVGKEDQIATFNGSVYTFSGVPTLSQIVVISNPATTIKKWNGSQWVLVRMSASIGGDNIGAPIDLGNNATKKLGLMTSGQRRVVLEANGDMKLLKFKGIASNNFLKIIDTVTGKVGWDTTHPFAAGTNVTFTESGDTTYINATGGSGSQTWQQTLINGSDLTQDNTSNFSGHNWTLDSLGFLEISAGDIGETTTYSNIQLGESGGIFYSQSDPLNAAKIEFNPAWARLNGYTTNNEANIYTYGTAGAGGNSQISETVTSYLTSANTSLTMDTSNISIFSSDSIHIQGNLDSSTDTAPNIVGIAPDGNWHKYAPATTQRFGIEDNLGLQDRSVDMQGFELGASNAKDIYWEAQNGANRNSVISANSGATDDETFAQMTAQGSDGSTSTVFNVYPNRFNFFANLTGDVFNLTSPTPVSGDYYIPLSVNGNYADNTGNITVSVTSSQVIGQEFTGSTSTTLTLSHNYTSGTIRLFKNGVRLASGDFTESAPNQITLLVARLTTDLFQTDFNY